MMMGIKLLAIKEITKLRVGIPFSFLVLKALVVVGHVTFFPTSFKSLSSSSSLTLKVY